MAQDPFQTPWTFLLLAIPLAYIWWLFARPVSSSVDAKPANPPTELSEALARALPDCVFFQHHPNFVGSLQSYWSKQQREIEPNCVVRPLDSQQVSTAVRTIKSHYDKARRQNTPLPTFAVRSGGHSTVPGAANTEGGILLDLGLLNEISPSEDRSAVTIGCGARWGQVSKKLDAIGLAVAGGRNSDVGVGGLILGGGYSYFSPQCGFVCDNVLEFEIVLASGEVTIASETEHAELWRALKGGGNNFGVVTKFVVRAFPCTKVWSGFLYMWSWKAPEVLRAFNRFVDGSFDDKAAGPLVCISYVQQIGITLIATHLMYTKPHAWPSCWQGFQSIGRIWSSNKVRTLTSATDELDSISPAGFRQLHISTTVKNDLATLEFAQATFTKKSAQLKNVKGMVWTLVVQPLHTSTMRHGKGNVLGLADRKDNLVVILFTAVWERSYDDDLVNGAGRGAIDEIDSFSRAHGTYDQFRYLNWCDVNERPFEGYGAENLKFLNEVRRRHDPNDLFQKSCIGGFKLA